MKIMTYNVYQGGGDRFPYIREAIANENPDILAIQEACQWKESGRFQEVADLLQIPSDQCFVSQSNSRSFSGRIYNIAFYSRFSIKEKEIYANPESVWHSLPHIILNIPKTLHIIIGHFSPKSEDWRLNEINQINNLLTQYKSDSMMLLGDLNSLSPHDPYSDRLAADLKRHKISKFGNPPRFEVISALENAGWKDALICNRGSDLKLEITVTEASDDRDHLDLRLDYVMVNETLISRIQNIKIINNEKTRRASDHFPVIVELSL